MNAVAATPALIDLNHIAGLNDFEAVTVKLAEDFSFIKDVGAYLDLALELEEMLVLSNEMDGEALPTPDDIFAEGFTDLSVMDIYWKAFDESLRLRFLKRSVRLLIRATSESRKTSALKENDVIALNGCLMQCGPIKNWVSDNTVFSTQAKIIYDAESSIPDTFYDFKDGARFWTIQGNDIPTWNCIGSLS